MMMRTDAVATLSWRYITKKK